MTKITIGARSSNLSLAYVSRVKDLLIKNNEELNETDIKVKTITKSPGPAGDAAAQLQLPVA